MEYEQLTEKIIGCAYRVHNGLGIGFLESVYHQSLLIDLREVGLDVESEAPVDVFYRGEPVGCFKADLVVEGVVILELKAVAELVKAHEVQLVNDLVATGKPIGLLINFGSESVEVRRKVRELKPSSRPSC